MNESIIDHLVFAKHFQGQIQTIHVTGRRPAASSKQRKRSSHIFDWSDHFNFSHTLRKTRDRCCERRWFCRRCWRGRRRNRRSRSARGRDSAIAPGQCRPRACATTRAGISGMTIKPGVFRPRSVLALAIEQAQIRILFFAIAALDGTFLTLLDRIHRRVQCHTLRPGAHANTESETHQKQLGSKKVRACIAKEHQMPLPGDFPSSERLTPTMLVSIRRSN